MRETGNTILHIVGGFVLLLAALFAWYLAGPVGFVFGWLREQSYEHGQAKERWDWDAAAEMGRKKPTFLDEWWRWQTPHKLWEAAQWGIGGALAGGAARLLGW